MILLSEIHSTCTKYNVTLGECQSGSSVHHRGIILNFENKSVQLVSKFVDKFVIRTIRCRWSWGETRSLIAMILYALQVFGIPLCNAFELLRFLSRHTLWQPRRTARLWTASQSEYIRYRHMIVTNEPRAVERNLWSQGIPNPLPRYIIFSDASLDTIGGMLYDSWSNSMWSCAKEAGQHHINVLEGHALLLVLNTFRGRLTNQRISVFVDNIPTIQALLKQHSTNYYMNSTVRNIHRIVQEKGIQLFISYIASKFNPADAVSRTSALTHDHKMTLALCRA
jgi:hypothetical protein